MREHEGDALPALYREVGHGSEALAAHLDGGAQLQRIGPRRRQERALDAPYPRNHDTVAAAQNKFHAHWDAAAHALNDADYVGAFGP